MNQTDALYTVFSVYFSKRISQHEFNALCIMLNHVADKYEAWVISDLRNKLMLASRAYNLTLEYTL